MDLETEILDLKRRVGDLEGAMNVLSGQMGKVHPELLALGEVTVKRFDGITSGMDRIVARIDLMNTQVWSLRDDLPGMLAEALKPTGRRLD